MDRIPAIYKINEIYLIVLNLVNLANPVIPSNHYL